MTNDSASGNCPVTSDTLRRAAVRAISLRGAMSEKEVGEALAAVLEGKAEPLLEALVERGDLWRWEAASGPLYAAMPYRRAQLAGRVVEIGATNNGGISGPLSDDPVETLTHLLGPPDWRTAAEPSVTYLEDFVRIAKGPQVKNWLALVERGPEACTLARLSEMVPRQLRAIRQITKDWDNETRAQLDGALALWAGFNETRQWADPAQERIIKLDAHSRAVVVAGPGTGKTQTVRERITALLNQGVPAPGITIISYSRTAVAELRARLSDLEDVGSLDITTLDSLAARLVNATDIGCSFISYDQTIRDAIALILGDNRIAVTWLSERRNIVFDEAQDVLGPRRELMLALLTRLPEASGATVFCDPAQSIHEYSEHNTGRNEPAPVDQFLENEAGFERLTLARNYRTKRMQLITFAEMGRKIINGAAADGTEALMQMQALLRKVGDGPPPPPQGTFPLPTLNLFRWRAEAAYHATRMLADGLPVALSATLANRDVPPLAPAWLGMAMEQVDGHGVEALVSASTAIADEPTAPGQSDLADALSGALHHGRYETARMAHLIALGKAPPVTEPSGLLHVSTVHAAKGREADDVAIYLPQKREAKNLTNAEVMEETRILYVAGTRPRRRLYISNASGAMSALNGRFWRKRGRAVQVLITRADATGTVLLPSADPTRTRNAVLRWLPRTRLWTLHATGPDDEEKPVATLPEKFSRDVSAIFSHALSGRHFVPIARGVLRITPLTIVDGETLRVVPTLEGFVWINAAKE